MPKKHDTGSVTQGSGKGSGQDSDQNSGHKLHQSVGRNNQLDRTLTEIDLHLDNAPDAKAPRVRRAGSTGRNKAKANERNPAQRGQMLNRWPRAFARLFDLVWQLALVWVVLMIGVGADRAQILNFSNPVFYILLFLSLPLALLLDALIAGLLGNSPAKALVGVKPTTSRGESLGLAKHLKRNYGVWTDGFAMGLLPLTLLTLFKQFKRISGRREAIYDERLHARVRSGRLTGFRVILPLLVLLSVPVIMASDVRLGELVSGLTTNQDTANTNLTDTDSLIDDR